MKIWLLTGASRAAGPADDAASVGAGGADGHLGGHARCRPDLHHPPASGRRSRGDVPTVRGENQHAF